MENSKTNTLPIDKYYQHFQLKKYFMKNPKYEKEEIVRLIYSFTLFHPVKYHLVDWIVI